MALSCNAAGQLSLVSAAGHASEAQRLELEQHLAGCARCSAEHTILAATTRALRNGEPETLTAAARERVRQAAMAQPARATLPATRLSWRLGTFATLAAAAAVVIWLAQRDPSAARVLAGDVVVEAATASGGGRDTLALRSRAGGRVRLGEASTELARATAIVWQRERRSIELRSGSVTVDVEHRPGQHFAVRTPRFVVEVVGTRFVVDLAGVRTEHGKVRVLANDGTLIAEIEAGQSWRAPAEGPAPAADTAATNIPQAHAPAAVANPVSGPDQGTEGAESRLARARRALAHGKAADARRAVEPVFRLGRDVACEARAINAESYLIEGRYADAIDAYALVIRDFPRTPQAESALYAIAQLESEHGRPGDARASLVRYLERYPRGRFAKQAADRLAGLPPIGR
jgi:ferric-dicitrate binding protein FerR (iron transport regulator)